MSSNKLLFLVSMSEQGKIITSLMHTQTKENVDRFVIQLKKEYDTVQEIVSSQEEKNE